MGCNGSKKAAAPTAAAEAKKPAEAVKADFEITLERKTAEQALGLSVVDAAPGLTVEALKEEGMVPDFHKANEATPEQHLKAGDRIIAVNGVSGDAEQMKKELADKTKVVISVQRAVAVAAKDEAPPAAEEAKESTEAPALAGRGSLQTEAGGEASATETETAAPEALPTVKEEAPAELTEAGAPVEAAPTAEAAAPTEAATSAEVAPVEAATEEKAAEAVAPAEAAATEEKVAEAAVETEEATVKAETLGDLTQETGPVTVPVEIGELQLQVEGAPEVEVEKEARCKLWLC